MGESFTLATALLDPSEAPAAEVVTRNHACEPIADRRAEVRRLIVPRDQGERGGVGSVLPKGKRSFVRLESAGPGGLNGCKNIVITNSTNG